MRIKIFILLTAFLLLAVSSNGEDADNKIILRAMSFPDPEIKIGVKINDPLYAVNIMNNNPIVEKITITDSEIENDLNTVTDSEKLYETGNYYKNRNLKKYALMYFKKYLKLNPTEYTLNNNDIQTIINKGNIYYYLSEYDVKSGKKDYLEKTLLYYTKAIEINPDDESIWVKLGDSYLLNGNINEAQYCYQKISDKTAGEYKINARIQAAVFQGEYLKLSIIKSEENIERKSVTEGFNFDYIETSINNSQTETKGILRLQQHIYLLRLLLLKSESYFRGNNSLFKLNTIFTKDEMKILNETEELLKSIENNMIKTEEKKYIYGIVSLLKGDYKKTISIFKEILTMNHNPDLINEDILFIYYYLLKDTNGVKLLAEDLIRSDPEPVYYLILAVNEYRNSNLDKAEMLCYQAIKISENYSYGYSGIAVISAIKGNYIAADEMIKKEKYLLRRDYPDKDSLITKMIVNEAAIALLKNEKERAYILLRSVLSADNKNASLLYNRYFNKNEKIQN